MSLSTIIIRPWRYHPQVQGQVQGQVVRTEMEILETITPCDKIIQGVT